MVLCVWMRGNYLQGCAVAALVAPGNLLLPFRHQQTFMLGALGFKGLETLSSQLVLFEHSLELGDYMYIQVLIIRLCGRWHLNVSKAKTAVVNNDYLFYNCISCQNVKS